ncbi:MAG: hypothetical protein AABX89_03490 [Candidatus Thermoplasmatota archaeon]
MRPTVPALLILLAGCLQSPQGEPGLTTQDPLSLPTVVSVDARNLTWSAALEGDVALRINVVGDTTCDAFAAATGSIPRLQPPFVVGWDTPNGNRFTLGSGQRTGEVSVSAEVAGIGEDAGVGYPFQWADRIGVNLAVAGSANFTVGAAGLHLPPDGPPFWADETLANATIAVRLACDDPVAWSFSGSREAVLFGEGSMGLVRAHTGLLDPAGASVAGRVDVDLVSPEGWLLLDAGGDLLLNRVGIGVATITTPAASDTWVLRPHQLLVEDAAGILTESDTFRSYRASSGRYTVELTYASAELMAGFQGAALGFGPLTSPDDLLAD